MCSIDRLAGALVNVKIYDILTRYHKPRTNKAFQGNVFNIQVNNTNITNRISNSVTVKGLGKKVDVTV